MTLATFIGWNGSRAPRGAISRVAEHLGVHHEIVKRYLTGDWPISARMQRKIDRMIARGISLRAKYGRRKCQKRGGLKTIVRTVQIKPCQPTRRRVKGAHR
jgi:hypothetical protein